MMKNHIEISVIIPIFNAEQTIEETVVSVQNQSRTDWQALIIDDGSDDNSAEIVARLAVDDNRIKLFATEGRKGAGAARNLGIKKAQGRYIAFLDADDFWHERKLEMQLAEMERHRAPFSCTAYLRRNFDTGEVRVFGVPEKTTRTQLLKTNIVGCSTAIYDQSYFGLRQMPLVEMRQDFALWLELLNDTSHVLGLPLILTTYREQSNSLSGKKDRAAVATWKLYRKALRLSRPSAAWYFANYAVRGMFRHKFPQIARRLGWLHDAAFPKEI